MGDIDGDGVVKLAVGARGIDDMNNSCGGFFVLSLETDGSVKSAQKVSMLYSSFSTFYTLDAEDYFGTFIEALGDLDGNGLVDLVVGARHDGDGSYIAGAVYVIYMETDGDVSSAQKMSNLYSEHFGFSVTGLGDVDGDNVMDLAVGAPLDDGVNTWVQYIW